MIQKQENLFEYDFFQPQSTLKRTQTGKNTTDLVFSAYTANNEDVFPVILSLFISPGAKIADVTYGLGVFWKKVDKTLYDLHCSDIKTGIDCRNLPYSNTSFDCVVLDPPYMEGFFRRKTEHLAGNGTFSSFRNAYSDGHAHSVDSTKPKYHDAVIDLYFSAGKEAYRILKKGGVLIVKCQDEVSANRQHFTHIELINHYSSVGYYAKDLFVIVRNNRPNVTRIKKQVHARKNHSYFLVFVKK